MEEYIIANYTDTGKVRSVNEDSMTTFDSPNGRVVVVCDGMGGQNAGDVASQLAVTVIQDILTDNTFSSPEEAITKSIIAANQAILVRSSQDEALTGMGSTCVMIIIVDNKVYYGSVGDSRIYYVANGMIRQITKDQSYVQTLVDAGELTQEAAEHHKDKNQITNALGIEGMTPPVVGQMPITPEPGSIFLLCSDGLSGMLTTSVINQVVSNSKLTLQDKAKELIKLANSAGGLDNITVQLVEFPRTVFGKGHSQSKNSGNISGNKTHKNKAVLYWVVTIICLVLAIAVVTYWIINNDDPKPTTTATIKNEKKEKTQTPTKPANIPQTTSTKPSEEETQPQVKIKESRKAEKPKKGNNNLKKNNAVDVVKELQEQPKEPEEKIKEIKETDLHGEKE